MTLLHREAGQQVVSSEYCGRIQVGVDEVGSEAARQEGHEREHRFLLHAG